MCAPSDGGNWGRAGEWGVSLLQNRCGGASRRERIIPNDKGWKETLLCWPHSVPFCVLPNKRRSLLARLRKPVGKLPPHPSAETATRFLSTKPRKNLGTKSQKSNPIPRAHNETVIAGLPKGTEDFPIFGAGVSMATRKSRAPVAVSLYCPVADTAKKTPRSR